APGQLPEMQARFAGLPVDGYLPDDWRARLTGRLSGHLEWKPLAGQPVVEGEGRLTDGTLSALPMLEKIAVVTRTDRFRSFRLHDASATIRQQGDRVEVRDLKVESTGLLKVEGAFSLRNGEVDGTVNLGVTPAALQWLPGARSRV